MRGAPVGIDEGDLRIRGLISEAGGYAHASMVRGVPIRPNENAAEVKLRSSLVLADYALQRAFAEMLDAGMPMSLLGTLREAQRRVWEVMEGEGTAHLCRGSWGDTQPPG